MKLTRAERWILANQMEILMRLDPARAMEYRQAQDVITRGYTLAYSWYSDVLDDEVPLETCHEVIDILDMFQAIARATAEHGVPEGLDEWELRFHGFDGDSEAEVLALARFLIDQKGEWQEHADAGDDLNSQTPTLEQYRAMLRRWEGIGKRLRLNQDQLIDIVKAGRLWGEVVKRE
jgi:uncharacterized protein